MIKETTACFLATRNLGDITIMSSCFRELVANDFADNYVVWTRPSLAFLFDGIPNCTVVQSNFPVGTNRNFGMQDLLGFLRAIWKLRCIKPTWSIDYVGDFRERFFGRMIGASNHLEIGWAPGHPYNKIIRNPFGFDSPFFIVPEEVSNVYLAYRAFNGRLLSWRDKSSVLLQTSVVTGQTAQYQGSLCIGLHPFASQACKKWPAKFWGRLANLLLKAEVGLTAFGAPSDLPELRAIFAEFGDRVNLVTVGLPQFAQEVTKLNLMVGLDSFSVHMAERAGVASVFINGANDSSLFAPPNSLIVQNNSACRFWPCYNKPRCMGTVEQYICISSIDVRDVYQAISSKCFELYGVVLPPDISA